MTETAPYPALSVRDLLMAACGLSEHQDVQIEVVLDNGAELKSLQSVRLLFKGGRVEADTIDRPWARVLGLLALKAVWDDQFGGDSRCGGVMGGADLLRLYKVLSKRKSNKPGKGDRNLVPDLIRSGSLLHTDVGTVGEASAKRPRSRPATTPVVLHAGPTRSPPDAMLFWLAVQAKAVRVTTQTKGLDVELFHNSDLTPCRLGAALPRIGLTFGEHLRMMTDFLTTFLDRRENQKIERVTVVGHSLGADLALHLAGKKDFLDGKLRMVLLLDPNLCARTCYISGKFAQIRGAQSLLESFKAIGQKADTLPSWRAIHGYLQRLFDKFDVNLSCLSTPAADLAQRYSDASEGEMAYFIKRWDDAVSSDTRPSVIRVVLSYWKVHQELFDQLTCEREDIASQIVVEGFGVHHFRLIDDDTLSQHLAKLTEEWEMLEEDNQQTSRR